MLREGLAERVSDEGEMVDGEFLPIEYAVLDPYRPEADTLESSREYEEPEQEEFEPNDELSGEDPFSGTTRYKLSQVNGRREILFEDGEGVGDSLRDAVRPEVRDRIDQIAAAAARRLNGEEVDDSELWLEVTGQDRTYGSQFGFDEKGNLVSENSSWATNEAIEADEETLYEDVFQMPEEELYGGQDSEILEMPDASSPTDSEPDPFFDVDPLQAAGPAAEASPAGDNTDTPELADMLESGFASPPILEEVVFPEELEEPRAVLELPHAEDSEMTSAAAQDTSDPVPVRIRQTPTLSGEPLPVGSPIEADGHVLTAGRLEAEVLILDDSVTGVLFESAPSETSNYQPAAQPRHEQALAEEAQLKDPSAKGISEVSVSSVVSLPTPDDPIKAAHGQFIAEPEPTSQIIEETDEENYILPERETYKDDTRDHTTTGDQRRKGSAVQPRPSGGGSADHAVVKNKPVAQAVPKPASQSADQTVFNETVASQDQTQPVQTREQVQLFASSDMEVPDFSAEKPKEESVVNNRVIEVAAVESIAPEEHMAAELKERFRSGQERLQEADRSPSAETRESPRDIESMTESHETVVEQVADGRLDDAGSAEEAAVEDRALAQELPQAIGEFVKLWQEEFGGMKTEQPTEQSVSATNEHARQYNLSNSLSSEEAADTEEGDPTFVASGYRSSSGHSVRYAGAD